MGDTPLNLIVHALHAGILGKAKKAAPRQQPSCFLAKCRALEAVVQATPEDMSGQVYIVGEGVLRKMDRRSERGQVCAGGDLLAKIGMEKLSLD